MLLQELFFSFIKTSRAISNTGLTVKEVTTEDQKKSSKLQQEDIYLWAIWDGPPTLRCPILWGTENSREAITKVATQYGLDTKINYESGSDISYHVKQNGFSGVLEFLATRKDHLISYVKKRDKYIIGAWVNELHFLCDDPPILLVYGIDKQKKDELVIKLSDGNPYAASEKGSYLKRYITKREALRKIGLPSKKSTVAAQVEFIYADHRENFYRSKPLWRKHRIVKTTKDSIFIERFPFHGGYSYLVQGWQSRVIHTIILKRHELEVDGVFYHISYRTTFYTRDAAKKEAPSFFNGGNSDESIIYELPTNSLQWALSILELDNIPIGASEVKKAFRVAAMKHHPDRGGNAEMFVKCKAACEFLIETISTEL